MFEEKIFTDEFVPVLIADIPDKAKDAGHGLALSVKIVLPTYCQANCRFCFNKETLMTQQHDWYSFLKRLDNTLTVIFNSCDQRRITLDITGAEPTFDPERLNETLGVIRRVLGQYYDFHRTITFGDHVDKVVLTTNGFRLRQCMELSNFDIIDIINISIHSVDYGQRQEIFRTKYIPSNRDLKDITCELRSRDKIVTAVAVLDNLAQFEYREEGFYPRQQPDPDKFEEWIGNFAAGISEMGFCNGRIRMDYTNVADRAFARKLLARSFNGKSSKLWKSPTLDVKDIHELPVDIKIFKGVPDIGVAVRGMEFIIDDDGFAYLDYSKNLPLSSTAMKRFNDSVYLNKNYKLS